MMAMLVSVWDRGWTRSSFKYLFSIRLLLNGGWLEEEMDIRALGDAWCSLIKFGEPETMSKLCNYSVRFSISVLQWHVP